MKHRTSHQYRPSGGALSMTIPVAGETLKRAGNKMPHPKIDRTDMNTIRVGETKGSRNRQRGIPQKNSQNKRLLWEALVEGNPPPYSDLNMTSRGPGQPPHENLIIFGFPMNIKDPQPYYDDCLVPLTVRHLLVECPSLIDLRHRYLYRCRGRESGVYHLSKVLKPACLAPGHDIFNYLAEAVLLSNL
ncbi:hypothetical protein E2C01_039603 [Portunus trituberculatus]|uniref:Uncharacterized protein n=1 Tax=Portunus trituberculatus TaxID=210409 RepID=A0A5B7FK75_PORTR|nr:hypothetical protein [Portunus trituberculatus]